MCARSARVCESIVGWGGGGGGEVGMGVMSWVFGTIQKMLRGDGVHSLSRESRFLKIVGSDSFYSCLPGPSFKQPFLSKNNTVFCSSLKRLNVVVFFIYYFIHIAKEGR